MSKYIRNYFNFKASETRPTAYPRRYIDWLERPLSVYPTNHPSDFWLGKKLDYVFCRLSNSPSFNLLLEDCPEIMDVPILLTKLEENTGAGGYYNPRDNLIAINMPEDTKLQATASKYKLLSFISHEYRHAYQYLTGTRGQRNLNALNDESLVETLLGESDAVAFQARVCHELNNKAGLSKQWGIFKRQFPTVAKAFTKELKESNDIDKATTKSIKAWFDDADIVEFYIKKYASDLQKHADKIEPHSSAWQQFWQEQFNDWQNSQPILIPAQFSDKKVNSIKKPTTQPPKKRKTPASVIFNSGELRGFSPNYYLQSMPPSLHRKITKIRKQLQGNSQEKRTIYDRINNSGYTPF